MQVVIISNCVNDYLGFVYLRNMINDIKLSGIITSGGHSKIKRFIIKSYLKILNFPDWNIIPIFATLNENNDDYFDINEKQLTHALSILNPSNKSFIELENDCLFPSFSNEFDFLESLNILNGTLLCMGQITPLYNAYIKNNSVLNYFDNLFISGNIFINNNKDSVSVENNLYFASSVEYYQTETQKITISIDFNDSYIFCGIWNKNNRTLMEKNIIDVDITNISLNLFKIIYEKTNMQLYFIGPHIGEMISLNEEQLNNINESINFISKNTNNQYYPTDALTIAYFDSVVNNKNIRDLLRLIMFETVNFRIKVIGNVYKNIKSGSLNNNLAELLKINTQKKIIENDKELKSVWWKRK